MNTNLIRYYCSKIFNFATVSNDLLSMSKIWLPSAYWRWHVTIHLAFSVFTSRPSSLLACKRAPAYFFTVFIFLSNKSFLTSKVQIRSWCVQFSSNPSWYSWTFLMAYSKSKLKNRRKSSPLYRPFWLRNEPNIFLHVLTLLYVR
jgi:hypothetical protein